MKCVIYARVSSKEQEETGYSLPAQEKFLREYAQRNRLDVERVFSVSESASGRIQRKTFTEMLRHVKKHAITTIIVETTDRLTRNFSDVPALDKWIADDDTHEIHLAKEGCILNCDSKSHEWFMWRVKVATAEYYIRQLSENVKKGLKEKLTQGWLPTKPPLGFMTIGETGHKTHVLDPANAPLVRKMFELYATGEYSLKKLAEVMYTSGLRARSGKMVVKSRVATLLNDPFYIGKIRYNGIVHPGAHEPLVSENLFESVQRRIHGKTIPRFRKHFPLFKSLIRCAVCSGLITWEIQKGHWYGHCNGYRACTARKFVRQEIVEQGLLPYVEKITIQSRRLLDWMKRELKKSQRDQMAYALNARDELQKRSEAIQKRLDTLYDDKLDGKISEDFYQRKYNQYMAEKDEIVRGLKRYEANENGYYELGACLLDLAHRARTMLTDPNRAIEDRRVLLNIIFSNLMLNGDKINVFYGKAFEILSEVVPLLNEKFEPSKMRTNKGENAVLRDARPILLARWDDFRTTNWSNVFDDPIEIIEKIRGLFGLPV